jgi:acetyl-CoA carboxylase biotin carboxyl carrier protein
VDIKEIRTLIDLMKKNGVAVFKMEREGFKITLKTAGAVGPCSVRDQPTGSFGQRTGGTSSHLVRDPSRPVFSCRWRNRDQIPYGRHFIRLHRRNRLLSLMSASRSLPTRSFRIIEAMKVMNEVKAEVSGVVTEICAENGKPVQFGQPLFRLK